MTYYATKSSIVEKNYVVIRHGIPNVNSQVMGVRFRDSWAVVEKDSKIYFRLRKLPMLKNPVERPLSFLKELSFINRPMDVKLIFGADVYAKYITLDKKIKQKEEVEKVQLEEKLHIEDDTKCRFRLETGKLCRHNVQDTAVSSYCPLHILKDPRLEEIDFTVPLALSPKERKKLRKRAFNKLSSTKIEENINVSVVEEEKTGTPEQTTQNA